jgi:predicted nucleic acid-binding Zn ribbon protein
MSKSPHCPICYKELDTVQFLLQANEVFSEVGHRVKFDCCGTVFYIESDRTKKWYEGLKHYENNSHCKSCGKAIDGKRKYCNVACRMKAYRKRKGVTPTVVTEAI